VKAPIRPHTAQDAPHAELRISIFHVPDCPSVNRLRAEVEAALECFGATAVIEEIEGGYLSPTLLIDGTEIDGYPLGFDPACRVDIPTTEEIATAIRAAGQSHGPRKAGEVSK
jgi:hypothetical protein